MEHVCLVTGGAAGIGQAFSEVLIQQGCYVVVADLNVEAGESLEKRLGARCIFVRTDACRAISLQDCYDASLVRFHKRITIVINNAGIALDEKPMFELVQPNGFIDESWRRVVEVDLNAVILGTQVAIKNCADIVVNVSSMAGLIVAPGAMVYTAAKHGVVGFTKSCVPLSNRDPHPIRVCAICPTFVDTELFRSGLPPGFTSEDARSQLGMKVLTTADIARGLIQLIFKDGAPAGAIMRVTAERGADYANKKQPVNRSKI